MVMLREFSYTCGLKKREMSLSPLWSERKRDNNLYFGKSVLVLNKIEGDFAEERTVRIETRGEKERAA